MDEAQRRIRNLSPITISISLKNIKADMADKDLHKCLVNWRLPPGTTTVPSVPMADGQAGLLLHLNEDNTDDSNFLQGVGELADFNKIQFFIVQPPCWSSLSNGNIVNILQVIFYIF